MNFLRDELAYLFSGQSMPYEKVAIIVAVIVSFFFGYVLSNNAIHEGPVAVIDLDNSKYSQELIEKIDASPFMKVDAVLNTAVEPKSLFYGDRYIAVVYLPPQLEKNHYSSQTGAIGVFYDNSNLSQSSAIKSALNAIIAADDLGI